MTAARKVDFDNAKRDLDHVAAIATSRQNTATDRTGQVTPTLYAQLMKVGVLPPVAYAGGVVFGSEDITKSIERSGVVYVPLASALPFTTSGTWGTDQSNFRVIQGVTASDLVLPGTAAGIGIARPGGANGGNLQRKLDGLVAVATDYPWLATGDGVADDTAELNAMSSSGVGSVHLGWDKTFKTTDTWVVPDNVEVDFGTSKILYAGPRDRPAVQFGSGLLAANEANLSNGWVESSVVDVSNDSFVGIKAYNVQRNKIDVYRLFGFTHLVEFVSRGQGVTGVTYTARFHGTCKNALTTTCVGPYFNYINGNNFFVQDWTNITTPAGDSHGWLARGIMGAPISGTDYPLEVQNGNTIHFGSIQPGNGSSGEVRNAVKIDNLGSLNTIRVDRYESGRGHFAVISGPAGDGIDADAVAQNVFEVGLWTSGGGDIIPSILEQGSARLNTIRWLLEPKYSTSEFTVNDLASLVKSYNSGNMTTIGPIHITEGSGNPFDALSPGGVEMGVDFVAMNSASRSFGFFVDIDGGEVFQVWADTKGGNTCAVGIACYDATGARMTYPGGGAVPVLRSDALGRYNRWSTDLGGAYISDPSQPEMTFSVDSAVKRLRVFVYGGTGWVRSFGLRRVSPGTRPLTGYSGLIRNPLTHYVNGDPTSGVLGRYGRGDIAVLDSASGSGLDAYQFNLGGYLCPAWAPSTVVVPGRLRHNGGNVYECTAGGTTASSGGPSGTGSSIADGPSVVWRYVSTKAVATLV